jgi:hypothetical protein
VRVRQPDLQANDVKKVQVHVFYVIRGQHCFEGKERGAVLVSPLESFAAFAFVSPFRLPVPAMLQTT